MAKPFLNSVQSFVSAIGSPAVSNNSLGVGVFPDLSARSRRMSNSPRVVLSVTVIVFIVVPFCKERTRGRCSYCVKGTQADDVHTEYNCSLYRPQRLLFSVMSICPPMRALTNKCVFLCCGKKMPDAYRGRTYSLICRPQGIAMALRLLLYEHPLTVCIRQ